MAVRFNAREWVRAGLSPDQIRFLEHVSKQVGETTTLVLSLEDVYDLVAALRPASASDLAKLRREVAEIRAQLPRRSADASRPLIDELLHLVASLSRRVSDLERLRHRLDDIEKDYSWR